MRRRREIFALLECYKQFFIWFLYLFGILLPKILGSRPHVPKTFENLGLVPKTFENLGLVPKNF